MYKSQKSLYCTPSSMIFCADREEILQAPMQAPVVAEDGYTYEVAVVQWSLLYVCLSAFAFFRQLP